MEDKRPPHPLEAIIRKNLEELDAIWRRASSVTPSDGEDRRHHCCLRPSRCGVWNGRCLYREDWLAANNLPEPKEPDSLIAQLNERARVDRHANLMEIGARSRGGESRSQRVIREMQEIDRSGQKRGDFERTRNRWQPTDFGWGR